MYMCTLRIRECETTCSIIRTRYRVLNTRCKIDRVQSGHDSIVELSEFSFVLTVTLIWLDIPTCTNEHVCKLHVVYIHTCKTHR